MKHGYKYGSIGKKEDILWERDSRSYVVISWRRASLKGEIVI